MKKVYILLLSLLSVGKIIAQEDEQNMSFEEFSKRASANFSMFEEEQELKMDEMRRKANEELSRMMGQPWESFETQKSIEKVKVPEPPKPTIKTNDYYNYEEELEFEIIIPMPEKYEMPEPMNPIVKPEQTSNIFFDFSYYNTPCRVEIYNDIDFSINDLSEKTVSKTWSDLASAKTDILIADCLKLRSELQLCDWGYLTMLDTLCNNLFPQKSNEAVLLKMYILTQSGYNVRIAKSENKLVMLLPTREIMYNYSYVNINGEKYYVLDNDNNSSYSVFNYAFPKEKTSSLCVNSTPKLWGKNSSAKKFVSQKYSQIAIEVSVNKNLIEFYNQYPQSNWNNYVEASLSEDIKRTLYPKLRQNIEGMSQEDAANILIDFVQTAFDYKTDDEQFGYERPLFGDEIFFYPYSDCEDRSILFAILVQELLNLDVVLLNYPGHLATAVHFTENINGDYMTIDNKKYLVCDPTYIGASIGDAMPQYETIAAKIIEIKH